MANRMKEDEKNERIIRGLLKLPENRRCINCNSLGPQYVCTNFWTFVCMTCGGIHREFTHRVKSVSMAKFTSQEVNSLQGGGNENARQMYFKDLDMQRLPDNSNVERLRDFIKRVYVDRRYTGERNSDPPSRTRMGDRDNFYENKGENTRGSLRSPLYEETYYRRQGDRFGSSETRYNFGEKSPGYEQESRFRDYGRSSVQFDVSAADGRQDDRMRSPSCTQDLPTWRTQDLPTSSPPEVRPVRDILGENVPSLHVGDSQKVNAGSSYERNEPPQAPASTISSLNAQRTESSSGLTSSNTNLFDPKRENFGSLIDFDADPEPAASIPSTFSAPSSINQFDANNWASFDSISQGKAIETSSNINPLESSLLQLSTPPAVPVPQTLPLVMGAGDSSTKIIDGRHFPGLQPHSSSIFATANSLSTASHIISPVSGDSSNQAWSSFAAGNTSSSLISQTGHQSQIAANPFQGTQIAPSQVPNVEPQPRGRKELPENLFTRTYSPILGPAPGWHPSPNFPGYGMPFPTVQQQLKYPGTILRTNPFEIDITNGPTLGHSSTFPSLVSLQGGLQSTGSSTLVRSASVDTLSLEWIHSGPQTYPDPASASGFMVQNASFPMHPLGNNADGNISNQNATFNSLAVEPQQASSYIQPTPLNNLFPSRGGNPFE